MCKNLVKTLLIFVAVKVSQSSKVADNFSARSEVGNEEDDGKSSLVFVFDTTGSMSNDLKQLREGAEMILNTALEESNIISDFVFVPFHDPAVGPATVTRDKQVFKTALDLVEVYGGGDCPEKSLGGIQLALSVSLPRSFIYVFTDATAGDHRLVGKVLDAVQRKQTQVVFVLTGHCNDLQKPTYQVYQQIAAASSGLVFNLNKTSVHKVLDFVRSSITGRTVNLGSSMNPAGHNFTQDIPVDSTLGEVTVSVSGAKPQITVVNPSGEQLTGPPKLITTLDLSEIMVVKVMQPEPGNWTITVGSEEDYSVKVVGLSNLTFSHGFSVARPRSAAETSYRPLKGTYNHMMISLTETDKPVEIEYAEIVTLQGNTLFELPLTEVDSGNKTYLADAFIPPDEFFYIAINGRDENDQQLRRIGSTAVQPKLPDVPYLSAPRKVQAHSHSRLVLKCKVDSLVPVTAMWMKDHVKIQAQVSSLQTTTIEYVIEDMREENVGTYRCVANNVAGHSRATTDVTLLVERPQVTMEPANTTVELGADVTISCTAVSEGPLLKFHFVRNNNYSHVMDIHVEPNMEGAYTYRETIENANEANAGNYTCIAANRGGSSNKTATISVRSKPTAQILGPHEVSTKFHENATLYCYVDNSNTIYWTNEGKVVKELVVEGKHTDSMVVNVTNDAVWTCKAVRGKFKASDTVRINVLLKPAVAIQRPKNITVLNGTNHEIVCEVVAKPQPRILWYRGSEETFLNHTITSVGSKTYKSVLILNSSAESVEGTYFCVGENTAGIHQDSVNVDVRRKMSLVKRFNDTSVQLYNQTELHCSIDAYPPARVVWFHNGTVLNTTENVQISEDDTTVFIKRVHFDSLGEYSCEGDNGFERVEVKGTLSVFGLESPVLAKENAKRTVKKGESTKITCRVLKGNPKPRITWFYLVDDVPTLPIHNVTSSDGSSEIRIDNVTVQYSGVYRCIAENDVGKDEWDVELVVHYPPVFKTPKQSDIIDKPLQVEAGENVTFTCEAEGIPPPIVLWSKDGHPMAYSRNIYLTEANDLVIKNTTEYDSGLFTCNVTSPLGFVEKNFTLFVYVPPNISPPTVGTEQEILEGQLVELPCEAKGVPSPEVLWQHNGDTVADGRKYVDEFGIRFIANLTDFGNYTCTAKNEFGNTSLTYSLFIWMPPYIEPPLIVNEDAAIGENASLQCDVLGFPIPTVLWEFEGVVLKENTTGLSFNDVGNLYVTNASLKHEGVYACVAENVAGVARRITHLNVNEPPKIMEDNYTGPYLATNMDTALTIACRATGKPKPYVLWSKDDYYLDKDIRYEVESDRSLTIKSPTEDLSGNYTCIAKNTVGTVNKTVEVLVYSLPTQMQSEDSHTAVTVLEHTNTSVPCPIRASRTDTVKWYKDATLISTGDLQITNLSRSDQNSYACVVTNAVGSAYSAITLNVEWPPKFNDENESGNDHDNVNDHENENDASNKNDYENENDHENEKDNESDNDKLQKYQQTLNKDAKYSSSKRHARLKGSLNDKADRIVESGWKIVEIVKGGDTYLDCSVDAKPIAKTKWLFNSKPIIFEDNPHLKVMNVQPRSAGDYRCVVSNKHGTNMKKFTLKVFEPPFISEFDVLDVSLMVGVNATLACDAKGSPVPTVQWTYNNTNWHLDHTSLTTTNITTQSGGLFRCDARNDAGSTHIVYRVSVVSAARVDDIVVYTGGEGVTVDKTVEAVLGSHVRIACKATGNPTPTIQWLRNGKALSTNAQDINYADFTIDAQTINAGGYSCVVTNQGGSDERKIRLEVLEPPRIFKPLSGTGNTTNLEVLSGQAYYLHCHSYGNPFPEIYWFRDGLPLMLFDDTMVSKEFGEIIEVKSAKEEQSGNYTCVARNKVGNTSVVYLVDILVPPPIPKEASRPVEIHVGKPLTLTCPVEGSPLPNVMWIKQPYTEIGENTPRVVLSEDNVTLFIMTTQVSDSGNYSCIMTNKVGSTEVTFDVTVAKPPSIAGNVGDNVTETHVVPMRRSVVLKCEADGHPLPTISWLKDTQQLSNSLSNIHRVLGNSLLAIWSVSARDAGQYICVVENSRGTQLRRYNVQVKVPGKWTSWGQWSFCNATCGPGLQHRSRTCQYVDENNSVIDNSTSTDKFVLDESACKGPSEERRKCQMPPCEEEETVPHWSAWSRWSPCSATCGSGTQARTRKCKGRRCEGDNVQIRKCPNLPKCDSGREETENDVYATDTSTKINEYNAFAPEAVFETQPEIVNSHYSPDIEEFYRAIPTATKQSTALYDVNVTDNLDGSAMGPCSPGFRYIIAMDSCDDIDECVLENNQCHSTQVCVNTEGAYSCTCSPGLMSLDAGQRCMDINECTQEISGCEYACVNVVGGYVCACPPHLRLHADRHHCYSVLSSYRKPYSYEDLDMGEYLSTSIEYPARYKHIRNV